MAAFDKDLDSLFVGNGLTSDQAASRAALASPTVRRKIAEVDAAIAIAEQAELTRVPQVRASASAQKLSEIPPFVIGIGNMNLGTISFLTHSYDAQATLAVPLSDYVLRYPKLIDAARKAETAAKDSRASAELDAGEEARLAYYEWVRSKLEVIIAKRQLVQVQSSLAQVRALADAQRLSKADLLRVESQEAEAEQTVDQLTNLAVLREEQLRLEIGATETEPLAIGEDIRQEVVAPPGAVLDDLQQHALQRRMDVRTLDAGIAAKNEQMEAERANGYPHLAAIANIDDARPNQRQFPQKDEFTTTWTIGLQLTWQLSDTLVAETNRKRLIAETNELRSDRENLVRGARIELLASQQAVAIAQRALATTQKGLAASEEGYRVRRELLAADRVTAVELVDAETDLTRARIAALNARVDLRVAMTQLSHALGDDNK